MTTIYMVEDFFRFKDIDKKWEVVKNHYEIAYKVKFKHRPTDSVILDLYKKLQKLRDAQYFHSLISVKKAETK